MFEYAKRVREDELQDPTVRRQVYGVPVERVEKQPTQKKPKGRKSSRAGSESDVPDHVKLVTPVFIIGSTGEWDAREDYVVVLLSLAPSAEFVKRGNNGKSGKAKYIKLTPREKDLAVRTFDSLLSQGVGVNNAVRQLRELGHPFTNVALASIKKWKAEASSGDAGSSANPAAGRKATIPPEHREAIMRSVSSRFSNSSPLRRDVVQV